MEIKIFDDKEQAAIEAVVLRLLKPIEDTLVRALVRAARIIVKEKLIAGYQPPQEIMPTVAPLNTNGATPPIEPTIKPVAPVKELPRHEVIKQKKAKQKATRQRAVNRNLNDFLEKVGPKPEGYITTEEAREIVGGREDSAASNISRWIWSKEVHAVIAYNTKLSPTKGIKDGGRVFVKKADIVARNELRQESPKSKYYQPESTVT